MCFSALIKRDMKAAGIDMDSHWIREDLQLFERRSESDPKKFPAMKERIFQGTYAPVFHYDKKSKLGVSPMRYGVYQPEFIKDPRLAKAFNARRDNLQAPYWSEAFQSHHGFVLLDSFFEWVGVGDLVSAGRVEIKDIKSQFEKESKERKLRILATGKKYALTPTEKKDALERKIIIQFHPEDDEALFVPVLFTERVLEDGYIDRGFAIVTDDPQHEVLAAGHDRSPSFITREAVMDWIDLNGKRFGDFQNLLDQKPKKFFEHHLASAQGN
ncbi:MAG: SOS response-associated peptidase family protein [Bdellovibrionota bacterium]